MKRESHYFDLYPKVILAGKEVILTLKCKELFFAPDDGEVPVTIIPTTELKTVPQDFPTVRGVATGGTVRIKYCFEREQAYLLQVFIREGEWVGVSVYALGGDLYGRIPLKGDLHLHSNISDGWESPAALAGYCRQAGFDFMAITDHRKFEGAQIARAFFRDAATGLHIIDGEEVHSPNNPVHIVSLGCTHSISDIYNRGTALYFAQVRAIMDSIQLPFADEEERFVYAACQWVYGQIRAAGGMAVLAHPHSVVHGVHAYNVRDSLLTLQYKNKCFDALELIGGKPAAQNNLDLAFYYDACKKGYGNFPIVGNSDSHGALRTPFSHSALKPQGVHGRSEGFGLHHTLVFAHGNTTPHILSAIREHYNVVVEGYAGEAPRLHGDYRLVSYAQFLMDEYFPLHDEICREEGRLMLQMACGEAAVVCTQSQAMEKLREKYLL